MTGEWDRDKALLALRVGGWYLVIIAFVPAFVGKSENWVALPVALTGVLMIVTHDLIARRRQR